jgi:hypothetical protein
MSGVHWDEDVFALLALNFFILDLYNRITLDNPPILLPILMILKT